MDFPAVLATTTQALGPVKELRSLDQSLQNAEVKAKMVELYAALGDMRMSFSDAQAEHRELEMQNAELLENFKYSSELVEYEGHKYLPFPDGKPSGMPFCSVCEQNHGKLFMLTRSKGHIEFTCPNCKSVYHHLASYITKEFKAARDSAEAKSQQVEIGGYKFDTSEESGEPSGYAYCPNCEIDHGKLYRLTDCILPNRTNCNKCKSTFPEQDTRK